MNPNPYSCVPGGLKLELRLQPGAKREAFAGMYGSRIKLAVQSPPVDGRANAAAGKFLARFFGVAAGSVELLSGAASRDKVFLIRTSSPERLAEKIKEILP